MGYQAVIFDLGGVVLDSPLHTIARYERELGIPAGFVNRVVIEAGADGAWARLERGELAMEEFFGAFEAECRKAGQSLSAVEMMLRIGECGPRPVMLEAIRRIRHRGIAVAALTNNWVGEQDRTAELRDHFDAFVESSVVGLRKPDPRIYRLVCETLSIEPAEAAFLDDIGRNLKIARELGMKTIKVDRPEEALQELSDLLGFPLL
jgi:epoxide hydrolase-like predicted phosphatase